MARFGIVDPSTMEVGRVFHVTFDFADNVTNAEGPQNDWGDAPDTYGTTLANNGARHSIDKSLILGLEIDRDRNGKPSVGADRDDVVNRDDEDGVRFITPILPNSTATVEVYSSGEGKLDAWIDFGRDGNFDAADQIFTSVAVVPGVKTLQFNTPGFANNPQSPLYARFRLSSAGGLSPRGPANDGEVEDYRILTGDANGDNQVDAADVDVVMRAARGEGNAFIYTNSDRDTSFFDVHTDDVHIVGDVNSDGSLDQDDVQFFLNNILQTTPGDVDLNGRFDSGDLVKMFTTARYENNIPGSATFADGDMDGNGLFDSSDLVKMFSEGRYDSGASPIDQSISLKNNIDAAIDQLFGDEDEGVNRKVSSKSRGAWL
ncbi:MAG: hypothetical protein KDB27_07665 [Planctomycetales bacterium]|nr:hypothetical protein [Planctomycetales bacterium]